MRSQVGPGKGPGVGREKTDASKRKGHCLSEMSADSSYFQMFLSNDPS